MRWLTLLILIASNSLLILAHASTEKIRYTEQRITLRDETYTIKLPIGYQLELLTEELSAPRMLTFTDNGDLFIGARSGDVYRLQPPYRKVETLITLQGYPHSIAFKNGKILIAFTNGVYQTDYKDQHQLRTQDLSLLAALPGGGGHNSRTIAVGPDNRLYASLGISGNCSEQYLGKPYSFNERRGGVLVLDEGANPPQWLTYGSGLRNPVGFDWHPQTKDLYASNNGPDHLGYDLPPEYFSRVTAGSFHGMPWFQYDGKQLRRDNCAGSKPPRPITDVAVPAATFPARNAPMGVAFVPTGSMGKIFEHDALVALKGSWGTQPRGDSRGDISTRRHPKIVAVRFENGQAKRVDDLLTGFQLENGRRWARPTGITIGPDGAVYFTSDSAINGLFRIKKVELK